MTLMKTSKIIFAVAAVIALGSLALLIPRYFTPKEEDRDIMDSTVKEIKSMVKLCSADIYEEVPIKASIGNRHIFARVTLKGTISFDIERLDIDQEGDTLHVALPPEEIEILESTDKDSYIVIDTWSDKLMGNSRFTTEEENKIKEKVKQNAIKNIYAKGYVRQARAEAAANLGNMISTLTTKPVKVTDPTPGGKMNKGN